MDYEDERQSKFNAGVAFAERLDSLQRAYNASMFNPLAVNMDTGMRNYHNALIALNNLLGEAWSKLSKKEKEVALKWSGAGNAFIFVKEFSPITNDADGKEKMNYQNYQKLVMFLELYNRKIKDLLDAHGLNNPDVNMDEGL